MFAKGHEKIRGYRQETKDKCKKVHKIFDEVFDKLTAKTDLSSGLAQAMIIMELFSK